MTPQEIITEVLNLYTDNSGYRPILEKPFEIDGYIYATDSHTVFRIKNTYGIVCEPVEGTVPKADALFNYEEYKDVIGMRSEDLLNYKGYGNILGLNFKDIYIERVKMTTRLLGIDGWFIGRKGNKIMLSCGIVDIILCAYITGTDFPSIPYTQYSLFDENLHLERAEEAMKELQEKRAARAAKEAARPKIWSFTLARYATMYVEAATEEEAEKIAKDNMGELDDFDFDGTEIDSYDTMPDNPCSYMHTIYTADGTKSYDDYEDEDDDDE